MIYELRIYTCIPGTVATVLEMWEARGQAMIAPYMKMVGQWVSESGTANQIYTLWAFDDMNHRQQAREQLLQQPDLVDYLAECRQYYLKQEVTFLSPTALSPLDNDNRV